MMDIVFLIKPTDDAMSPQTHPFQTEGPALSPEIFRIIKLHGL